MIWLLVIALIGLGVLQTIAESKRCSRCGGDGKESHKIINSDFGETEFRSGDCSRCGGKGYID